MSTVLKINRFINLVIVLVLVKVVHNLSDMKFDKNQMNFRTMTWDEHGFWFWYTNGYMIVSTDM